MKISVVVATYNRCLLLKNTLEDLLHQEKKGFQWEIIVVDNNSVDDTKTIVRSIQESFEGRLKYYFEPEQGKPFALNRGIKESSGDIIAFTDDDVRIDSKWLSNIIHCFDSYPCDGVGGKVVPIYPKKTPLWIKNNPRQAAGTVVIYDYGEGVKKFNEGEMDLFIGANYAFKKSVFKDCGAFRTDLTFGRIAIGEDLEFINRLLKTNAVLYYSGDAIVSHPVDLKRAGFIRMAQWHIALGRFCARMESETKNQNFTYLAGVPRYIYKGAVEDFILMLLNFFDRLKFFKHYRSFFRYIGMIKEYRS